MYKFIEMKINDYEYNYIESYNKVLKNDNVVKNKKLAKDYYNLYSAALSALFDFVLFYKIKDSEKLENDNRMQKQDDIKNKIASLYEKVDQAKSKSSKTKIIIEINRIVDFGSVYEGFYTELKSLSPKDVAKIIKFAEKKKANLIKKEENDILSRENYFIAEVSSKIKNAYANYNLATQNMVDRLYRGGTNVSDFSAERKQFSLEYLLLIDSVKNAISLKSTDQEIKTQNSYDCYIDFISKNNREYDDAEYKTYDKVFSSTYDLSSKSLKKLQRKLKGKLD